MNLKNLLLLCFLSGILLVLSFPPFNLTISVWVGLIPLLIAFEGLPPRRAFSLSYLTGIVYFLGLLHWVSYVTLPGFVLLVLYLALYFGIFGLIVSRYQSSELRKQKSEVRKKSDLFPPFSVVCRLPSVFWIPSLWVVLEFIRGQLFTGFGWGILGYSQWRNLPVIQIADITGVYGISFLIVMVSVTIYEIIREARLRFMARGLQFFRRPLFTACRSPKSHHSLTLPILFTCLFLFSTFIYGYARLAKVPDEKRMRVAVVQGNVLQAEKWDPGLGPSILSKYRELTMLALADGPELIIWPETAVPGWVGYEPWLEESLSELAREVRKPILVGGPFWDVKAKRSYNSALLISRDGELLARYDKLHLVPFGEYIPLGGLFGLVERIDPRAGGGHFSPGEDYTIFETKYARFGVLICFEDIFPELVKGFVNHGAEFMVNITNDAWFGPTGAPYQHAQASVLRAVELRTSVVRCANTGFSCFIDPFGRITGRVMDSEGREIFTTGYLTGDVSLVRGKSFYSRFGGWFIALCILISMTSGVGFFLTRR